MKIAGRAESRTSKALRARHPCPYALRGVTLRIRRACARMQPRIAFFIRNVRAREREQVYGTVEYWTKVKFILHYFSVRGEPMYYRNTSSSVACVRASMISVCILIAMM